MDEVQSTHEDHKILPHDHQGEDFRDVKVDQEISKDIRKDGSSCRSLSEKCPMLLYSQGFIVENFMLDKSVKENNLNIEADGHYGKRENVYIKIEKEDVPTGIITGSEAMFQDRRKKMQIQQESSAMQLSTENHPGPSSLPPKLSTVTLPTVICHRSTSILGKRRRPNFSYHEVDILVNNVVDMLLTSSRSLTAAGKLAIWQQITQKVNTVAPITRSVEEVKKRWQDFRRRLKDKLREHYRHARGTGGGRPNAQLLLTTLEQRAIACIHLEHIQGLSGVEIDLPLSAQQHFTAEDVEEQQQYLQSPRLDPQSPSPPLPLQEPPDPKSVETPPWAQCFQEPQSDGVGALEYHEHLMEVQRQQLFLQERQVEVLEGIGSTLSRLTTAQERLASAQERQNLVMEGVMSVLQRLSSQAVPTQYGLGGASAAGEPELPEPLSPSPAPASALRLRPSQEPAPGSEVKRFKRERK